jgi:hypothetical protein
MNHLACNGSVFVGGSKSGSEQRNFWHQPVMFHEVPL